MLVDPDIWRNMVETRLKYAENPYAKQLYRADAELESILQDPNLSHDEKQRLYSQALQRVQMYRDFTQKEQEPSKTLEQKVMQAPIQEPTLQENAQTTPPDSPPPPTISTPVTTKSHPNLQSSILSDSPTFASPIGTISRQEPLLDSILQQIPQKQQKAARNVLQALMSVPEFTIDPNSLEFGIKNEPVHGAHIVDIIRRMENPLLQGQPDPPGLGRVLQVLAKTNLAPSYIADQNLRQQLIEYRKTPKSPSAGQTPIRKLTDAWGKLFQSVKELPEKTSRSGMVRK